MTRIASFAVVLALALAGPGQAAETASITGTIRVPNPGATYETAVLPSAGVTRNLAACDDQSEWQGFDAAWVNVADYRGYDALATTPLPEPDRRVVDFDVYFYDADCRFVFYFGMAEGNGDRGFGVGVDETGVIPDEAVWAQITMWSGPVDTPYEFRITASA